MTGVFNVHVDGVVVTSLRQVWPAAITTAPPAPRSDPVCSTGSAAGLRSAAAYRIHQLRGRSQHGALSFSIVCGRLPLLPWANTAAHCLGYPAAVAAAAADGGGGGGGGGGGDVFRRARGGCLERSQSWELSLGSGADGELVAGSGRS